MNAYDRQIQRRDFTAAVAACLRDLGFEARSGEECVEAPATSTQFDGDPCTVMLYANAAPQPEDGGAEWGVQVDYPNHLYVHGDDDPTLGEGWRLLTPGLDAAQVVGEIVTYASEQSAKLNRP